LARVKTIVNLLFFSLYVNIKLMGQMMAITEELGSSSEEEDDPTKHHVQKKVEQSPEPEFLNF
jgi:hypothetical protein